ncbi:hypothetical protein NL532_18435 [Mesorhizobium sp. C120A]|uniref:hypothetical protein n=1 Tax=unclassified Mesorhizobium TaxID=325217 RepID=UPI000413B232|nr:MULTISPECIES: hypothetical protein [unclassified Mesorhizobium]WJI42657.1 hypothetical protein NL532_18435 [Mesorhizobium sp. C120A]
MLNFVVGSEPAILEYPQNSEPPEPGPLMQKAGVAGGIAITLNVISLALAIGMVVMLIFLFQSIREVSALEDRLSGLGQFETRLSRQLDTVNQGVQSQFGELNRRISALVDQTAQLEKQVAKLTGENQDMAERLQAVSEAGGAVLDAPEPPREIVLSAPPSQPKEVRSEPARPANPVQFERTVSPDGKVTYSKVRK